MAFGPDEVITEGSVRESSVTVTRTESSLGADCCPAAISLSSPPSMCDAVEEGLFPPSDASQLVPSSVEDAEGSVAVSSAMISITTRCAP